MMIINVSDFLIWSLESFLRNKDVETLKHKESGNTEHFLCSLAGNN